MEEGEISVRNENSLGSALFEHTMMDGRKTEGRDRVRTRLEGISFRR
jgi:hypothetical protein